jgi:hypothetical protein
VRKEKDVRRYWFFAAAAAALLLLAAAPWSAAQQAAPEFSPDGGTSLAAASAQAGRFRALDEEVQDLKQLVVELNRDLFLLEEELLFPANTQVSVFLSMDVGEFFALDSVQLRLNNRDVASHLYTAREVDALMRGGVQRLYIGNIRAGEHELIAVFTGRGPHEREYRRATSIVFEKGIGPRQIELAISDREQRLQPEFIVRQWD